MKKLIILLAIVMAAFTFVSCASTGSGYPTIYAYTSQSAETTKASFIDMMKTIALEDGASEAVAEATVSFLRAMKSDEFLKTMGYGEFDGAHLTLKTKKVLSLNGNDYPYTMEGNTITFAGDKTAELSEDGSVLTVLLGDDDFFVQFPFHRI